MIRRSIVNYWVIKGEKKQEAFEVFEPNKGFQWITESRSQALSMRRTAYFFGKLLHTYAWWALEL